MRFPTKSSPQRRSSRALIAPAAFFLITCGIILLVVSFRVEYLDPDDPAAAESPLPATEREMLRGEPESATRSELERVLRHIDEAEQSFRGRDHETGESHLQRARDAVYQLLLTPGSSKPGEI